VLPRPRFVSRFHSKHPVTTPPNYADILSSPKGAKRVFFFAVFLKKRMSPPKIQSGYDGSENNCRLIQHNSVVARPQVCLDRKTPKKAVLENFF
jgi:hypothetical protein